MHHTATRILLLITMCFCAWMPASADDNADKIAKEGQVKVAFLYNFVKFIEWPGAQALAQTHTANICILGDNPFGEALGILQRASSPQLTLNVKQNISKSEIPSCQILFIARTEGGDIASLLAHIHSYPILTVSEIKGFADDGGIVEMVKTEKNIGLFSENKINLRINEKVAEASGLRIDAQLLGIATEIIK